MLQTYQMNDPSLNVDRGGNSLISSRTKFRNWVAYIVSLRTDPLAKHNPAIFATEHWKT